MKYLITLIFLIFSLTAVAQCNQHVFTSVGAEKWTNFQYQNCDGDTNYFGLPAGGYTIIKCADIGTTFVLNGDGFVYPLLTEHPNYPSCLLPSCVGDFNEDGAVDVDDLLTFFIKLWIMQLEVLRFNYGKDSTNGMLFEINNGKREFLCYTLEDESREEKVWGETCIPEGEYCLGLRTVGGHHAKYSKRFADIHLGMLHVLDVPNFKYILIHCGNTDEDTAGCLLLGNSQVNNSIKTNGFIGNSTEAYFNVYPRIAAVLEEGQDVTIKYTDFSIIE